MPAGRVAPERRHTTVPGHRPGPGFRSTGGTGKGTTRQSRTSFARITRPQQGAGDPSRGRCVRAEVVFAQLALSAFFILAANNLQAGAVCVKGYRDTTPDERATALILLGPWQASEDALEPVFAPAHAAPTAAQTISVRITAEESRLESVLESSDIEALAAPLSR